MTKYGIYSRVIYPALKKNGNSGISSNTGKFGVYFNK